MDLGVKEAIWWVAMPEVIAVTLERLDLSTDLRFDEIRPYSTEAIGRKSQTSSLGF